MTDKKEKIIEICDNELKKTLQMFLKNPLVHFSEKDLHWLICESIQKKLRREHVVPPDYLVETGDKPYKSILVHQEYGRVGKQGYRQDIVVLDPEEINGTDSFKLMKNNNYLTPVVSIEIITELGKSWKSKEATPDKGSGLVGKLNKDFESLEKSRAEKKYLLIFYRVTNRKGIEDHEKRYIEPLEEEIKKIWKKIRRENLKKWGILYGIKYLKENKQRSFVEGV